MEGLYLFLQGAGTLLVGFYGLSLGPKYIPAAEVALFLLIETILGPVWVYVGGYESPPQLTLYGGVLLILALMCNR